MKRILNIVQVAPIFPPHIGGVEKYIWNISKQFAKMEHKVIVYTTNSPKGKTFEIVEGVVIHRLPVLATTFNVPISSFLKILREDPDIVNIHIPPPTGALSSLVFMGKLKKKPIIVSYHNDTIGNGPIERFLAKLYNAVQNRFILKNAMQIIVPSEAYKKKLLVRGFSEEKVEVIPGGINQHKLNRNNSYLEIKQLRKKYNLENKKSVLFVGALESRKGVEYLIKAAPKIVRQLPDVKIIIIGDGRLRNKFKSLAKDLKVDNFILFAGQVTDKELSIFYEASNVFVLPSLYETFGLVLLEAMAHGKPIVATKIPGVDSLIEDYYNGILIEPRDPEKLARTVIDLLSDSSLANILGKNGRVFVKKYNWERVAAKMLDVYQRALKRMNNLA